MHDVSINKKMQRLSEGVQTWAGGDLYLFLLFSVVVVVWVGSQVSK